MPITLQKIASDTASVSFPFMGETVNVTYRPSMFTERIIGRLRDITAAACGIHQIETAFTASADMILDLVATWDVLEEEGGGPIPVTREVVSGLPVPFRTALLQAIFEDAQGEARGMT
jgi:hypothetical protein